VTFFKEKIKFPLPRRGMITIFDGKMAYITRNGLFKIFLDFFFRYKNA
jgi:hypothetical protein